MKTLPALPALPALSDEIEYLVRRMSILNTLGGDLPVEVDDAYFCGAIDMLSHCYRAPVSEIRAMYVASAALHL